LRPWKEVWKQLSHCHVSPFVWDCWCRLTYLQNVSSVKQQMSINYRKNHQLLVLKSHWLMPLQDSVHISIVNLEVPQFCLSCHSYCYLTPCDIIYSILFQYFLLWFMLLNMQAPERGTFDHSLLSNLFTFLTSHNLSPWTGGNAMK